MDGRDRLLLVIAEGTGEYRSESKDFPDRNINFSPNLTDGAVKWESIKPSRVRCESVKGHPPVFDESFRDSQARRSYSWHPSPQAVTVWWWVLSSSLLGLDSFTG